MEDQLSQLQEVAELRSAHLLVEVAAFRMHQGVAGRPQGKEVARQEVGGSKAYQREACSALEEPGEVLLVAGLVGLARTE